MTNFRTLLIALLGTGAALMTTSASALPANWSDTLPAWTATASSCAVDESSAGKYEFLGSQFRFLGTNVSNQLSLSPTTTAIAVGPVYQPITVRCNVTPMYDYIPAKTIPGDITIQVPAGWKSVNWNALVVGYKDPDGLNSNANVSVQLKRVSRATLGEATVATFNSNSFVKLTQGEEVKHFTHAFDFQNNEYYVEISLIRTKTTVASPVAYSVRLTNGGIDTVIQ